MPVLPCPGVPDLRAARHADGRPRGRRGHRAGARRSAPTCGCRGCVAGSPSSGAAERWTSRPWPPDRSAASPRSRATSRPSGRTSGPSAATCVTSLRNVSVVRYDAFGDMGGRLSFSCAVVDDAGDGLVISSIHARGESRTYAKGIVGGSSEITLTPEEQEALAAARGGPVRSAGPPEPPEPPEPRDDRPGAPMTTRRYGFLGPAGHLLRDGARRLGARRGRRPRALRLGGRRRSRRCAPATSTRPWSRSRTRSRVG